MVHCYERWTKGNEHKIGRDGMKTNHDFYYEPDKLTEASLLSKVDID